MDNLEDFRKLLVHLEDIIDEDDEFFTNDEFDVLFEQQVK